MRIISRLKAKVRNLFHPKGSRRPVLARCVVCWVQQPFRRGLLCGPAKGATEVWTGSILSHQVARLNPKTNEIVEYLLPRTTDIRRIFVQETGPRPVLSVGKNHGATIVKVEPLD
jgi:hypothetical protein